MKRLISIMLALAMLFAVPAAVPAYARGRLPQSGKCGQNVVFSFEEKSGTLTVSGKGAMAVKPAALKPFCGNTAVKTLIVKNGVTNIDNRMFNRFEALETVRLADSVEEIGGAFCDCKALKSIRLSKGLKYIRPNAFYGCTALKKIKIPAGCIVESYAFSESGVTFAEYAEGATVIPHEAFFQTGDDYTGLEELYIPASMRVIWPIGNIAEDMYYGGTKAELKKIDVLFDSSDEGFEPIYNVFLTYKDLGRVYCNTSMKMPVPAAKNAEKGKNAFTVRIKEVKDAAGYQLQYSTGERFKTDKWYKHKVYIKNTKNGKVTVKKLKKGKKYYYRVRAYKTVDGKRVYSRWSKKKSVKI